jgi:hypothetical protein
MKNPASAQVPKILYIYREFWKAGNQAALERIEISAARMCINLGCPHPYLGIESLTGSKEVWYLNGFSSIEEQERVREQYAKKDLFSTMSQFTQQREPFQSDPDKDYYANYRADLSHGPKWSMGEGRFLIITVIKGDPKADGTVFETGEAIRFVVTPAETHDEAQRKLSAAGPEARLFAVRPHFSMPAPDWAESDPSFWAPAPGKPSNH